MQANRQELIESINDLKNYRDRLRSEIISVSQKLRMSEGKIEGAVKENAEGKKIENTIEKLTNQINLSNYNEWLSILKINYSHSFNKNKVTKIRW